MAHKEQNFSVYTYNNANVVVEVDDVETLEGAKVYWKVGFFYGESITPVILLRKSSEDGGIDIGQTSFTIKIEPTDFNSLLNFPGHYNGKEYLHEAKIVDHHGEEYVVTVGKMKVFTSMFRGSS